MSDVVAEFLQPLWELRISVYANVASLALLLFDCSITFGEEIDVIWRSKMKLSKALFLWIRYFGIATHAFVVGGKLSTSTKASPGSDKFCNVATKIQIAGPQVMWWSVEFVFALRVWILYNRSLYVLVFLSAMYSTSITACAVVSIKALLHISLECCADSRRDHNWLLRHRQIFVPLGRLVVEFSSFVQPVPDYVFAAFVVGILTTSTLCVMTVYRTLRFRNRHAMMPLLLFLRDGVLYYACVTVVFLLNLFMFRFSSTLKILFSGFLDAVPCMFGARVLMNILSLVREEDRHGMSTDANFSELHFESSAITSVGAGGSTDTAESDATQSSGETVSSGATLASPMFEIEDPKSQRNGSGGGKGKQREDVVGSIV